MTTYVPDPIACSCGHRFIPMFTGGRCLLCGKSYAVELPAPEVGLREQLDAAYADLEEANEVAAFGMAALEKHLATEKELLRIIGILLADDLPALVELALREMLDRIKHGIEC